MSDEIIFRMECDDGTKEPLPPGTYEAKILRFEGGVATVCVVMPFDGKLTKTEAFDAAHGLTVLAECRRDYDGVEINHFRALARKLSEYAARKP